MGWGVSVQPVAGLIVSCSERCGYQSEVTYDDGEAERLRLEHWRAHQDAYARENRLRDDDDDQAGPDYTGPCPFCLRDRPDGFGSCGCRT